jgi:hypothetical protein
MPGCMTAYALRGRHAARASSQCVNPAPSREVARRERIRASARIAISSRSGPIPGSVERRLPRIERRNDMRSTTAVQASAASPRHAPCEQSSSIVAPDLLRCRRPKRATATRAASCRTHRDLPEHRAPRSRSSGCTGTRDPGCRRTASTTSAASARHAPGARQRQPTRARDDRRAAAGLNTHRSAARRISDEAPSSPAIEHDPVIDRLRPLDPWQRAPQGNASRSSRAAAGSRGRSHPALAAPFGVASARCTRAAVDGAHPNRSGTRRWKCARCRSRERDVRATATCPAELLATASRASARASPGHAELVRQPRRCRSLTPSSAASASIPARSGTPPRYAHSRAPRRALASTDAPRASSGGMENAAAARLAADR